MIGEDVDRRARDRCRRKITGGYPQVDGIPGSDEGGCEQVGMVGNAPGLRRVFPGEDVPRAGRQWSGRVDDRRIRERGGAGWEEIGDRANLREEKSLPLLRAANWSL